MMKNFGSCNLVKAAIRKAAYEHKIEIHELEVMPEHIHMLVTLPKGKSDEWALHKLKGRSAFLIFKNKEKTRLRYPKGHFWARGGCAITVGYNDYNKAAGYIRHQLEHHGVALVT